MKASAEKDHRETELEMTPSNIAVREAKRLVQEALGDSYYYGQGAKLDADTMHDVLAEFFELVNQAGVSKDE